MNERLSGSGMKRTFNPRLREKGFSLVELLVVVAIFVALITLTIPDYLKNRPFRLLSGETNRLAAVIRQGRLFSLRDNQKTYLEFLPELDMYRLWSYSGWRAYSDIYDPANGRNPDLGDYDRDLDGDGDDYWDGGSPEDPNVFEDGLGYYYYDTTNWDGTTPDPDVFLLPTYPGNQPIRTVSPKLVIDTDPATGFIVDIYRDLGDAGSVAGDNIVPLDVDIRMENMTADWNPSHPIDIRNGVLSHFPVLFMTFFGDGTLAASWDQNLPTGIADEKIDLSPGALGAVQIYLQVRGDAFNPEAYLPFDPVNDVFFGDEGPDEPVSPFETLSIEDSNRDSFGRKITVNNLSGRVIIRNLRPMELDEKRLLVPPIEYL
jgi:prepilin-type N-terminal cleavage/methylation domain-containing protein